MKNFGKHGDKNGAIQVYIIKQELDKACNSIFNKSIKQLMNKLINFFYFFYFLFLFFAVETHGIQKLGKYLLMNKLIN